MPTLDWIGKKAVLNHHREVPYHLLKCDKELSVGDPGSGNLLVQGDNLLALKALLPYYAGQVKCIYIDPPYNTGNEGWVYNDATNSPEIRAWLGKVVGAEAEDLSRHDKWLCMMYPRIAILREFLTVDGAIFVSIADHEFHNLRLLMDEVFGQRNFVGTIIWQKVYSPKNSAKFFSEDHDYIVVYAANKSIWRPNLLQRSVEQNDRYSNPDNDPRGDWKTSDLAARNFYDKGTYSIKCPSGRIVKGPPKGNYWRVSEDAFWEMNGDNRIYWGADGGAIPQIKRFLSEVKDGVVPQTLWFYREVGHTQEAKQELLRLVDFVASEDVFITPKPSRLIRRILDIASDPNAIVLDSFAGSGTTGQAVLEANAADGGNRRFLLIEMEQNVASEITQRRMQRAITGEGWVADERRILWQVKLTASRLAKADNLLTQANEVAERERDKWDRIQVNVEDDHLRVVGERRGNQLRGLGGGFRYCTMAAPLFDQNGNIRDHVAFSDLASHLYFTETGEPIPKKAAGKSPLIGMCHGVAYYLLFNGVLGDRRPQGGNVLTNSVLESLPPHDGPRVIFGEGSRLSSMRLQREGIVFKQLPYDIKVR